MYNKYSRNLPNIRTRVYEIVNTLNMMYRVLRIHVALIGVEIWNDGDKIEVQTNASVTLDSFGAWRESDLLPRRSNDNAQLLTSTDFDGPTIGLGYVGTLCLPKYSSAIVQDHTEATSLMAFTMAHELGHNLGINHDTDACNCYLNRCIMAPTISFEPSYQFSSCSYEEHWMYLIRALPQCILNKPLRTDIVAPAVCGNYFVEVGEECNCGFPEYCQSICCNAATCKLHRRAQCDSEECCEQCRFKGAGAECRATKNDCDLAEHCTGQSAECPLDQFQRNGEPCQNNQGYCYNGKCPIMTNQCIHLLRSGATVSPDWCFQYNLGGWDYSYCRSGNGVNFPCAPAYTPECNFRVLVNDPDYGMVHPGTKCGDGKVCSNGQCVDVQTAY